MSGFALRGRVLERALALATKAYAKDGRCELRKQETPTFTRGNEVRFARKAPIDFRGTMQGGRAIAIEAKLVTTGASLDLTHWPPNQQNALGAQHQLGAWTRLVVAFDEHSETFACDWSALDSFLAAPWRSSLSLDWFRAHAELVEDGPRSDPQARRCWFLDGAPHGERAQAAARVAAERESALLRAPAQSNVRPHNARARVDAKAFARMSPDERRAHLFASMDEGLRRAGHKQKQRRFLGGSR